MVLTGVCDAGEGFVQQPFSPVSVPTQTRNPHIFSGHQEMHPEQRSADSLHS